MPLILIYSFTKIKDKTNGAVIEVPKELASDFVATGNFEIYNEIKSKTTFVKSKEDKDEE